MAEWRSADRVGVGVRLILLLVLLAGAGSVALAAVPSQRSQQDLGADIDAGRVVYLEVQPQLDEVRWSVDGWRWRRTTLETHPPAGDWLRERIDASGHDVGIRVRDADPRAWWPGRVPWAPLQVLTVLAWAGTFVVMLATPRHRYANRWAWFWLFTVAQVGAPFYLLLERRPLWRGPAWEDRTPAKPVGGGTGCLMSILLPIAASLVLFGVAELVAWFVT